MFNGWGSEVLDRINVLILIKEFSWIQRNGMSRLPINQENKGFGKC